jgi:hypothetical protein
MRIDHVLNPEVVLGRRGSQDAIDFYRGVLNGFKIDQVDRNETRFELDATQMNQSTYEFLHEALAEKRFDTGLIAEHVCLVQKFVKEKRPTYYLPKEFCQALSVVEKSIKTSYLPDEFLAYFAFPKDYIKTTEGHSVNGGYIYLGSDPKLPLDLNSGDRFIVVSYVFTTVGNGDNPGLGRFNVPVQDGLTISECLHAYLHAEISARGDDAKEVLLISQILLNAALYVTYEDEQVWNLRPTGNKTGRQKQETLRENKGVHNLCTIPVQLVNFHYHRPLQ